MASEKVIKFLSIFLYSQRFGNLVGQALLEVTTRVRTTKIILIINIGASFSILPPVVVYDIILHRHLFLSLLSVGRKYAARVKQV